MSKLVLPDDVVAVFDSFRTCELTTSSRDGTPTTWPTLPFYRPDDGSFLLTTSVGLPQKAYNIRRDPRVALLFSDPTGSGLRSPPTVLVQGDATCPDGLVVDLGALGPYARRAFQRQPASRHYGADPLTRRAAAWYFVRLLILVVPVRIRWWPGGDLSRPSREVHRVA